MPAQHVPHHEGHPAARPPRGHGVLAGARRGTRFHYDILCDAAIPGVASVVKASLARSITKALPDVDAKA